MSMTPTFPIKTERLTLRPFRSGDQEGLRTIRADPDVLKYLPFPLADDAMLDEIIARRSEMTALDGADSSVILVIEETATGAFAGDVGLLRYEPEVATAEIGYSLARAYQGRGFVQEACRAMMAWGFEIAELHRIIGVCDARNVASVNVMRRLGMRQEAKMIKSSKSQGKWVDALHFAILGDEWNA